MCNGLSSDGSGSGGMIVSTLTEQACWCVVLTFDSCASLFSSWMTGGTGQPIGGVMWKANELHVWQHIITSVTSQCQILCVTGTLFLVRRRMTGTALSR